MDTANANKIPHIDWAIEAKPYRIKLLIQAVYNVLPSPSKFFCWGKVDSPAGHLCLERGTLEHIFSCCPKGLGEGCCLWCHGQVLNSTAIQDLLQRLQTLLPREEEHCLCEGCTEDYSSRLDHLYRTTSNNIRLGAESWPGESTAIARRPDMLLISDVSKHILISELAVPWKDCTEEAHERKRMRYDELVEECSSNGWWASCGSIEVGSRLFIGRPLCRAITGASKRKTIKPVTEAAEVAWKWLWMRRGQLWVE